MSAHRVISFMKRSEPHQTAPRLGPDVGGPMRDGLGICDCVIHSQTRCFSRLQSADVPSVLIGLRSPMELAILHRTTKPFSRRLFALELEPKKTAASRAPGLESMAA